MTEATAEKTGARLANGRFAPGQCGNPGGARYVSKRQLEIFADLSPEFGGDSMTPAVRAELMLAANLMAKAARTKAPAASASAGNAARRILEGLRQRMKVQARVKPPSRSRLLERFEQKVTTP
jgi:hypothetical protein